jgi:ABC-type sugar transport system ATPase subunit
VTHDQIEAMTMAEKIAIMDRGRLQQYGTPDEVYNQPENRFVAGFVGSTMMNFIPTELDRSGDDLVLTLPVADAKPVSVHHRGGDEDGGSYTMGIRPEHIELVDPGAETAALRGVVSLIESLGPRNIVHLASDASYCASRFRRPYGRASAGGRARARHPTGARLRGRQRQGPRMSRIQIAGVTKRFGDVTALDHVELDIADGEFFCVLGPPGAGKTTLLRTIVGLERPEEGAVLIGGTDVTELVPSARNVSIVFQNLASTPTRRCRQPRVPVARGSREGLLLRDRPPRQGDRCAAPDRAAAEATPRAPLRRRAPAGRDRALPGARAARVPARRAALRPRRPAAAPDAC